MSSSQLSLELVLKRLNRLQEEVNALFAGDAAQARGVLERFDIILSELLPGTCGAIFPYDPLREEFQAAERISAGPPASPDHILREIELACQVHRSQKPFMAPSRKGKEAPGSPGQHSANLAAAMGFPLIAGGEVLGVWLAERPGNQKFNPTEQAVLGQMAGLAARVLALTRLSAASQQEQNRREKMLRRLRRAGMLISSRSSLKDTLDAILRMALEVTEASFGIFRLVDESGANLVTQSFAGIGLAKPATENLPINSQSVMGSVALQRESVVISDLREDPWKQIYYPFDYDLEMRSEIVVPLIGASGRLEGVLNLESPEVNAFDKEDRYILQILATQAVVAIEGIRLVDALQNISAMLYTSSLQQIHQALVDRACDLLNLHSSAIWLLDKDQLVVEAASDGSLQGLRLPMGTDAVSQSILTGQPVILAKMEHPDPPQVAGSNSKNPGAGLIVPLFIRDHPGPVGAFSIYAAAGETRDFSQSDWDLKVLSILGHYTALAIQNSAHLEALKLAEDQRATTETFAAIGDIAANLLHRLNNKVGTIPVRVEGIQDKCENSLRADPYLADNLEEIRRSASEAMQVVRESLDHLRPIQLGPVSVTASLREALASIRLPGSIQVESFGLDDLPPVQAGANRLSLVFGNLLDNAADAMAGRGIVTIRGKTQGNWVELRVADTGPGIPLELHERIFEFSYSSRVPTHPGKLGFGLWWVKSLMTRFGGKVTVESSPGAGLGAGTTFILALPVAKTSAPSSEPEPGNDSNLQGSDGTSGTSSTHPLTGKADRA